MVPTRLISLLACLTLLAVLPAPAPAQNPFAVRVVVDDRVVTAFDISQRVLFLQIFNTPGDLQSIAVERLIDERVQLAEARRMGIRPSEAEIAEGIAEFAARFDLGPDAFLELLAAEGLAPESFRAFVEAGISWRQVLQRRFGGRIEITDAEVARARQTSAFRGRPRVLLSELVLPATPDNVELAELLSRTSTPEEFAESARLFSAADSRAQGGRLDWVAVDDLPPALRPAIEGLQPGRISAPLEIEGAVILFLMRDIDRSPRLPAASIEVDFIRATVPAAQLGAELARLRARADICADFLRLTAHLPAEAVVRQTLALPAVPPALAGTLGRMDAHDIAATPATGDAAQIVMLCGRTPVAELMPDGPAMRNRMADSRLEALSNGLVAELRAAAIIDRR